MRKNIHYFSFLLMSLSSCQCSLWVPATGCQHVLGQMQLFPLFQRSLRMFRIQGKEEPQWDDCDSSLPEFRYLGMVFWEYEFKILDQRNSQVAISGKQALASEFISTHNWFFPPFISKLYVLWSSSSLMFMQRLSPCHSIPGSFACLYAKELY